MRSYPENAREAKVVSQPAGWHIAVLLAVGLLAGIAIGLFAGPYLAGRLPSRDSPPPAPAAVSPTASPAPTAGASEDTARANLMSVVVGATRHFRGAADAPITVVEFADFQ
jgi:protein-disulfide isomerase